LKQDADLTETDRRWSEWLEGQGFDLTANRDHEGSFFVGQRSGCAVVMNIEPDTEAPGTSLVVVRFLEE
jgi:hypothetical protein